MKATRRCPFIAMMSKGPAHLTDKTLLGMVHKVLSLVAKVSLRYVESSVFRLTSAGGYETASIYRVFYALRTLIDHNIVSMFNDDAQVVASTQGRPGTNPRSWWPTITTMNGIVWTSNRDGRSYWANAYEMEPLHRFAASF